MNHLNSEMNDPNATPPSPQSILNFWGSSIVSIYSLTIFLAAMIIAFIMKNEVLIVALVSVAATNATTVVGYWVGSSSSGVKKDAVIAGQMNNSNTMQRIPTARPPPVAVTPPSN